MTTIVNNPTPTERVERVTHVESDSGGWAIAIIVILLVAAGVFYWINFREVPAAPAEPNNTTINLTVPETQNAPQPSVNVTP